MAKKHREKAGTNHSNGRRTGPTRRESSQDAQSQGRDARVDQEARRRDNEERRADKRERARLGEVIRESQAKLDRMYKKMFSSDGRRRKEQGRRDTEQVEPFLEQFQHATTELEQALEARGQYTEAELASSRLEYVKHNLRTAGSSGA